MVVSNVRGRLPTKRIDMYKDHEFVVGRLVLGGDESAEAPTVIMGAGTWTYPIECAEEDHHFINLITRGMASGGSSKVIAIDHYLGVSGGSPTIFRGCMELEDAISAPSASAGDFTVRFGTAGSKITGEGHAVSAQLRVPNRAVDAGGVYSAFKCEVYLDGNDADPTPAQHYAIARFQVHGGNTAAQRKFNSLFYIIGPEGAMASKYLISNADPTTAGVAKGLQIQINGTRYWLAAYTIE